MHISSTGVGFVRCQEYDRAKIKDGLDQIAAASSFRLPFGSNVLLKPNLVSGRGHKGLACSHPEFVAAAAQWCLDHGAGVVIGDSPAFGRAPAVMQTCGISRALKGLAVKQVHFSKGEKVTLAGGQSLPLASQVLDCDLLINLPRVKAHSQTLVTLAVKNYFGTVKGFTKALLHQKLGKEPHLFARMLVDLLAVLPAGFTFIDGICAMHREGPVNGDPFPLGVVAGSENPVALDTALLMLLGVDHQQSMVWRETERRDMTGCRFTDLVFPLLHPSEISVDDFLVPSRLKPVPFQPFHVAASLIRRIRLLRQQPSS